jgi:hypothetical protein
MSLSIVETVKSKKTSCKNSAWKSKKELGENSKMNLRDINREDGTDSGSCQAAE